MICDQYEDLIGKQLLHNIVDTRGMMLIPIDTVLTKVHIDKLEKFKIDIFDIHVDLVEEKEGKEEKEEHEEQAIVLEPELSKIFEFTQVDTGELIKRTEGNLKEIESFIQRTGKVPTTNVEENVLPAIRAAAQKGNIYKLFSELKAEGNHHFNHSIGVAIIATTLGRWLQLDEKEMLLLTTAASLCDIGSVKLPSSLLQKTTELQPHEYEIMKQHTTIGYDLLRESDLDHRVALVALQHHERDDGSGYPAKLKAPQIDQLSKIVALADVYLAMTSERPYRAPLPFYQVINKLHEEIIQNRLDSHIGLTFLNQLMSAQVGNDVILSDGRTGRIVLNNANYPTSPLISIEDEFIDLSKSDSVKIKEIVG
jgi:HD-GYP domain-containing protein (c-di-GMP phosphodiesterase class II)